MGEYRSVKCDITEEGNFIADNLGSKRCYLLAPTERGIQRLIDIYVNGYYVPCRHLMYALEERIRADQEQREKNMELIHFADDDNFYANLSGLIALAVIVIIFLSGIIYSLL